MTISVLGFDGAPFAQYHMYAGGDRFVETACKLALSGSYVNSTGDSLDLTNGGGTPSTPTTIPPTALGIATLILEERSNSSGFAFTGGYYEIIAPNQNSPLLLTDAANLKLKIFNAAGTELAGGAYPSTVLADVLILRVSYVRQR